MTGRVDRGPQDATGYLLGKDPYLSAEWFAREQRDLSGRIRNLVAYEAERSVLRANMIFPNVPIASSDQAWLIYQAVLAPERSDLDSRIRSEASATLDEAGKVQFLRGPVDEEVFVVEQVQRVLRSSRFQAGPQASAHERPITEYQRELLAHLSAA